MDQQPANLFKQSQILYFALLIGQVIMGVVMLYLMQQDAMGRTAETLFSMLISGVVVLGIVGSQYLHHKQEQNALTTGSLTDKLVHFRKGLLLKCAVAEGANLLSLVLTFMFGNVITFLWFGVGVVMFAFLRPTVDWFATSYQLSQAEREELS